MKSMFRDKKRILIVGGYNKAKSLAISLIKKGYLVTVINNNYNDCQRLAETPKLNVLYGDGSKRFILEEADASKYKVVIALTPNDEDNLVICQLCKNIFGVKKTVSLLNDPSKTEFFYKMGIDRVVCALNMITNIMEEQAIMDEMTKMVPIEEGRIQIVELTIPHGAIITGKKLWEINLPEDIIIGCVLRGDRSLIPRGDTRVMEGDILLIIASDKNKIKEIRELMVENV